MPQLTDLPSRSEFRHHVDLQIRFNDIDILGHLNNTVYFSLYDTGKAYYMEAVNNGRMDWRHVESVIANIDCAFINSIYFGEEIEIHTKCEHLGDKSFTLLQMLTNKQTGEVKSVCRTIMVSYDPATKKSCPVSEKWRKGIEDYESGITNPSPTLLKESL